MRIELDETCHNDKPGRSDGDGGGRYKDEGGMRGEAGGRVRPATVASDGEEEVGRCE